MRIRALKYLIYRDFYLARKTLVINISLALVLMFFGILVALSSRYGNLALVPDNYQDVLGEILFMFSCFLPVYACAGVGISVTETMQFECDKKWSRFRLTTPISGYLFALARYIVILGAVAVCMGIALLYMWGNSLITGEPVTGKNIAFMLGITFVFLMSSLLMQILIQLLGSTDRAGIVMLFLMIPFMFGGMFYLEKNVSIPVDGIGMSLFLDLCDRYLANISGTFAVVLMVSFVVTAKLYKRREK